MGESMWVGKDEHEGVRAQARKDVKPPPHWRLEAIAQTPRPHSLTGARRPRASSSRPSAETSDVWLLDLDGRRRARAPDHRPRAGRLLGGHRSRASRPDGATVAYADERPRVARRRPPAARRASSSRAAARCGSTTRGWSSRSSATRRHDAAGRGRRRRPVAAAPRGRPRRPRRPRRRGRGRRLARRAARSPTPSRRAPTSTAQRDPRRRRSTAARCARVTGTPRHARQQPRVVAGRRDDRLRVGAQRLLRAAPVARTAERAPAHERAAPTTSSPRGTPTARACVAVRGRRNRFDLVAVDAATGEAEVVAEGGAWGCPQLDAGGRDRSAPTRTTRRRPSCASPAPAPRHAATRPRRVRPRARRTPRSRR